MSTPFVKRNPIWLARQDPEDPTLNPHYRRSIRYYRALYKAWPDWSDDEAIKALYKESASRREAGEDVNVDHLVPLIHPHVCGLHVPANLAIVSAAENLRKGNRWWPDSWNEQLELCFCEE